MVPFPIVPHSHILQDKEEAIKRSINYFLSHSTPFCPAPAAEKDIVLCLTISAKLKKVSMANGNCLQMGFSAPSSLQSFLPPLLNLASFYPFQKKEDHPDHRYRTGSPPFQYDKGPCSGWTK